MLFLDRATFVQSPGDETRRVGGPVAYHERQKDQEIEPVSPTALSQAPAGKREAAGQQQGSQPYMACHKRAGQPSGASHHTRTLSPAPRPGEGTGKTGPVKVANARPGLKHYGPPARRHGGQKRLLFRTVDLFGERSRPAPEERARYAHPRTGQPEHPYRPARPRPADAGVSLGPCRRGTGRRRLRPAFHRRSAVSGAGRPEAAQPVGSRDTVPVEEDQILSPRRSDALVPGPTRSSLGFAVQNRDLREVAPGPPAQPVVRMRDDQDLKALSAILCRQTVETFSETGGFLHHSRNDDGQGRRCLFRKPPRRALGSVSSFPYGCHRSGAFPSSPSPRSTYRLPYGGAGAPASDFIPCNGGPTRLSGPPPPSPSTPPGNASQTTVVRFSRSSYPARQLEPFRTYRGHLPELARKPVPSFLPAGRIC